MSAFDYSIEKLLMERGVEPKYRRAGYGMYLSPLRNETTASFKVDYNRNLWYDFGTGEGGGVVDLCMRLDRCGFSEVLSKLSDGNFVRPKVPTDKTVRVLSEGTLDSADLLDYIRSRQISLEVARGYCSELCIAVNGKRYFVLGFKNDEGGWEIRSRRLKISTSPKAVTTFSGTVNQCHIFEGFMDYLSFLSLGGGKLNGSAIVLNSVVNLHKCTELLKDFHEVFCYFDNDAAGKKALFDVTQTCRNNSVIDCSKYYNRHKDLNDFLTGRENVNSQYPELENKSGLKL